MSLIPPLDEQATEVLNQDIKNLLNKRTAETAGQDTRKHSLEYLKERANLALENEKLIKVARNNTPNASKEIALKRNFDEDHARSCRFLAIIMRDHGPEVFDRIVREHKETKPLEMLEKELIPRIQLLEAVAGAPLLVEKPPQKSDVRFAEYLLAGLPPRLEVKLALGDFRIYMKVAIEKVEGLLMPNISYRLVKNGAGLAKRSSIIIREDIGRHEFMELMVSQIMTWIGERDYIKGYEEMPVMAAVLQDAEERGAKLPLSLNSFQAVRTLIETGSVEGLEMAIEEVRLACLQEGVDNMRAGFGNRLMRYFEFEADKAMAAAKKQNRKLDPDIELLDKVNTGIIDSFISPYRVPGEETGLGLNFLLVNQIYGDIDSWLEALQKAGFGGCNVFGTFNLPSAMGIVQTGQIDILLMDKTLVGTEMRNWIEDIAGSSANRLIAFVHYENEACLAECLQTMREQEL